MPITQIKTDKNNNSGSVLLELVFVLPILLLIFLASFEFTRVLRGQQVIFSIAREAAGEAYRECSSIRYTSCEDEISAVDACLAGVRARMLTLGEMTREYVSPFLSNLDIALSVYREEEISGASILAGQAQNDLGCRNSASCSRFSIGGAEGQTDVSKDNELQFLLKEKNVLVIAEVFANYSAIDSWGFPREWVERQYYNVTYY